ncbi:MAG: hypothetical protein P8L69_03975 [Alphaproteobacteria bacterium]|nr:hypothetical protein [Alphaproteobacteria bacterium]
MKKIIIIISLFFLSSNVLSEEILRSVVIPLTKEDYKNKPTSNCRSFSEVLVEAKNEWKHVIPFKLSDQGLKHFLIGYNMQERLEADIVTVWPSYKGRRDQYYVLIGNNNCFVKWLELLPNSIQEIIDIGSRKNI